MSSSSTQPGGSGDPTTDFINIQQSVSKSIMVINNQNKELQKIQIMIGGKNDTNMLRSKIQIIQQNTNKTIKTTCGDIEKLNSIVKLSPPDDKSYRLMLEKIVSQFDDNVKKYLQSEKSLSMRMKKAVLVPVHEEENAEQDVDISQQQQLIRSSGLELVIDQESQFLKLETDIADIHSVMQNLSSMVYEQAEIVTSIEDSVNDTDHDVAAATKDLESAVVLNQKSRKMKLIIIIVVLVVVLIVGIIIYKVLIK